MSGGGPTVPLVLGGGGMLGAAVARVLEKEFPDTVSATRAEADVTDRFRLEAEVERLRPTVIVNCAAYTDVDGCELDADRARRVRLVHISTDFVFDGRSRRPYLESDPTGPLSQYGRTKLEGERRVAAAHPDPLIVRTSWLYGHGRSNFVDAIRTRSRDGGILKVVDDQFGSPTYVADLAEALPLLLAIERRGLVHFANAGHCSRHDLASAVVTILGAPCRLERITTEEAGRIAVRPAFSALDTSLYTRLTGRVPRPWEEALRDYLASGSAGMART